MRVQLAMRYLHGRMDQPRILLPWLSSKSASRPAELLGHLSISRDDTCLAQHLETPTLE